MLLFAGFRIDLLRAELRGPSGEAIKLRPKTFDMLVFLVRNAGRVLSKQELMERFWPGVHVGEDSLFQCIREIRSALGDNSRQLVKNISGRGYLFAPDVTLNDPVVAETSDVDAAAIGGLPEIALQNPVLPSPVSASLVTETPATQGLLAQPLSSADIGPGAVVLDLPAAPFEPADPSSHVPAVVPSRRWRVSRSTLAAVAAALVIVLTVGVPLLGTGQMFQKKPPTLAVAQITASSDDPQSRTVAFGVTDRLITGLARIENVRVVVPPQVTARASLDVPAPYAAGADYLVNGELQKGDQGWILRARMIRIKTGEVAWSTTVHVAAGDVEPDTQQSRLAAGIGHPLAMRINAIINDSVPSASTGAAGNAQVAVAQAIASINQTTPERFRAAQAILEKALTDDPDNVDVQAALAALQLRGIQMVWYSPEQRETERSRGQALLEQALRAKPSYVPVLEGYCRFLSATNRFVESLVACARVLSFDPWDGIALYHIGLGQMFLGRFEDALVNMKQADRYDTPAVSRWAWTLVAGVCELYMGHDEDALVWLKRSLAITPGTGRTHLVMVAAYQRLGRYAEAQELLKTALAMRPGVTAANVSPPSENTSPVYRKVSAEITGLMIAAGLPAQ